VSSLGQPVDGDDRASRPAFYTFLLLPTALRFDFCRDLDRLATLKGLPITPIAAAMGQTLTPVLIATLFQSGVLTLASVAVRAAAPPMDGGYS